MATGFETTSYLSGLEVIGIDGESLHDRWGLDPQAYLGVAVSGFPNFFMLYGPNTNQGPTRSSTSWRRVRAWSPVR